VDQTVFPPQTVQGTEELPTACMLHKPPLTSTCDWVCVFTHATNFQDYLTDKQIPSPLKLHFKKIIYKILTEQPCQIPQENFKHNCVYIYVTDKLFP